MEPTILLIIVFTPFIIVTIFYCVYSIYTKINI